MVFGPSLLVLDHLRREECRIFNEELSDMKKTESFLKSLWE